MNLILRLFSDYGFYIVGCVMKYSVIYLVKSKLGVTMTVEYNKVFTFTL